MLRLYAHFWAPLALLAASTGAQANTIFLANLTTSQEGAPVNPTTTDGQPRPTPFGTAFFELNDQMTELGFSATVFFIDLTGAQTADTNDNLTAAHIHAPAPPGTNATVVWGFFGMPFNDTNPNDQQVTPFSVGVGGTISGKWDLPEGNNTTLANQLANLLGGHAYINFHTRQHAGGEIRGQIIPQSAVPEPATMTLLGAGLLAMAGLGRRRRN